VRRRRRRGSAVLAGALGDLSDEDKSGSSRTALNDMNFFLIDANTQRN